ncbi:MAG: chemotaxis protein CheX [Myxococcales bacterium]|nr:chemotaxis protein CheX [Myxococcales bacterium]
MSFKSEHLAEVVRGVFEQMLSLDAILVGEHDPTDIGVTATIHISGKWSGVVTISASECLARRMASAMFEMESDELSEEEVVDAFGEMTNIIGGNIKSVVADAGALSLPIVTMGSRLVSSQLGGVAVAKAEFLCEGSSMLATVHELAPKAAAVHVA